MTKSVIRERDENQLGNYKLVRCIIDKMFQHFSFRTFSRTKLVLVKQSREKESSYKTETGIKTEILLIIRNTKSIELLIIKLNQNNLIIEKES
jgi:hypothetical protein